MNSHFSNIENKLSGNNCVHRLQTCFSNCSSSLPDELVEGAVDLHLHSYPEISLSYKGRLTDDELASAAQNLQMGGFVIKSHVWPTMERAFGLQTRFPNLKILGSLTLNPNVGGLNPWAVESAVQLGAKVLWLPTWGAKYDTEHHGGKYFRSHLPSLTKHMPPDSISLLNENGTLKEDVRFVFETARDHDLVVGTGHISPEESLKVAEHCRDTGFRKLIFTHPLSLGASIEEIQRMAELGFFVELTCLHILLSTVKVSVVMDVIRRVGYKKCLLTTDAFFDWTPPAPEMLRLWIGQLLYHGLPSELIRVMVYNNPRDLLT